VRQNEPYVLPFLEKRRSRKPYIATVPEGMLFVLGDNRDHSADSRVWGFVPVADVTRKATRIWLVDNGDRVGVIPTQAPIQTKPALLISPASTE
jgi:hypothetical protein